MLKILRNLLFFLIPMFVHFYYRKIDLLNDVYIHFLIVFFLLYVISMSFMYKKQNNLFTRRETSLPHINKFDRILSAFFSMIFFISLCSNILTTQQFFSFEKLYIFFLSIIILSIGNLIIFLAIKVNPFYETYVRVQNEYEHKTISKGIYALIRHPGMLGQFCIVVSTGILFNNYISYLATLFLIILLIIRVLKEDKLLYNNLEGYKDYSKKVKFKLIPGLF